MPWRASENPQAPHHQYSRDPFLQRDIDKPNALRPSQHNASVPVFVEALLINAPAEILVLAFQHLGQGIAQLLVHADQPGTRSADFNRRACLDSHSWVLVGSVSRPGAAASRTAMTPQDRIHDYLRPAVTGRWARHP